MQLALGPSFASNAVPLMDGDAGVAQTVSAIRQLVAAALKDPRVHRLAVEIAKTTPQYDRLSKAKAIYQWVLENIYYVEDPVSNETLSSAADIVEQAAGDCDDINGVLLPSLLESVGLLVRLVTIASNPADPENFSHIYAEVSVDGEWIPVDAARRGTSFGVAPPRYFRKRIWSLESSGFQEVGGSARALTTSGLAGYVSMGGPIASRAKLGQWVWEGGANPIATDITAAGGVLANIINAWEGNAPPQVNAPPSPWLQFQTPYTPSGPSAGYFAAPSSGISSTTLLWIGGGLLALLLLRGKR